MFYNVTKKQPVGALSPDCHTKEIIGFGDHEFIFKVMVLYTQYQLIQTVLVSYDIPVF